MNFKMILAMTVLLTSCTDFLSGKSRKNETLKIQIVDATCSLDFKSQVKKMMQSKASTSEIHQIFDCVDQYLTQLQSRVEGQQQATVFEVSDLVHLTNRFFKDLDLDGDEVKNLIKFKKALIGGPESQILKSEIPAFKKYLNLVRGEVLLLGPYFKMLSIERLETDLTLNEISLATNQMRSSLKRLLEGSQVATSSYSYEEAQKLLQSLGFFKGESSEMLSSFDRLKQLLTGDQSLKATEDYQRFIDNVTDAHQLYLKALYGHVRCEMTTFESTQKTVLFFDQIVNLIESTVQFQKTGRLSTHDLDQIIELLIRKQAFPFKVKFTTFRDFYKVALKKVFRQETFEFITSQTLETYRHESELWKLQLDFIQEKIKNQSFTLEQIQKSFSDYISSISHVRISGVIRAENRQKLITDLIDLNYELYNHYPIAVKNKKMMISRQTSRAQFEALDLIRGFYMKMLSRQLLKGWGNGHQTSQLSQSELTQSQMIEFMKDFDQFGVELKLNDPRSKNNGSKNFLEADLMGFYSDGNSKMSMFETFEYLHYLVAEGSWTVTEMYQDLKSAGCLLQKLDIFDVPYSDAECFFNNMKHNYSKYFSNKPGLVQFLAKMTTVQFSNYYNLLMDVARFEAKNKYVRVETVDVQSFVVMTSYIESMLVKYDENNDGKLSAQEIRVAYPKFKPFATDYSYSQAPDSLAQWDSTFNHCRFFYSKEDLIRESFVFMILNNGRTPTVSDMNYLSCSVSGIFTLDQQADRQSIINTFFVLKSVLASEK